jgi:hypothetical protein
VLWSRASGLLADMTVTAMPGSVEDGWCRVQDINLVPAGDYQPHWFADIVMFRGTGVEGLFDLSVAPELLEVRIDGARLVAQTGDPRLDYAYRIQSLDGKVDAALTVAWDRVTRVVTLSQLVLDFANVSRIAVTGKVANVDLSSLGLAQASLTGFAVTEADVVVTTHGLFETMLLMPLAPLVLPETDDVDAAVVALKEQTLAAIAALPAASFPDTTKDALARLIGDLPRPDGTLSVSLRSEAGFGPARLARFALVGVPTTMAEVAPVFDGVSIMAIWDGRAVPE